jgi:tetratricopeptide (TPR) repeat protein
MTTQQIFRQVERLYKRQLFNEAAKLLKRVPSEYPWTVPQLILKGHIIELSDDSEEWSLADARKSYETALRIDPENVEAMLELGWFHLHVMDNRSKALPYFEKAISVLTRQFGEALTGKASCIEEETSAKAASKFLQETFAAFEKTVSSLPRFWKKEEM